MAIDVTEATFEQEVIERSRDLPVVVDFWAEWCGPCRTLTPALEAAEAARAGDVVLAKVDVDANQAISARYGVQGIPAVKAFRDGAVASEFVGAVPKAQVEGFFDSLVPSRADELLAAGDELSLREASELEPRRADIAAPSPGPGSSGAPSTRRWRRSSRTPATSPPTGSPPGSGSRGRGSGPTRSRRSIAAIGMLRSTACSRRSAAPRGRPARTCAERSSGSSARATRPIPPHASSAAASPPRSTEHPRLQGRRGGCR